MDILIVDHRHGADGAGNDLRHTFASDYLQNGGGLPLDLHEDMERVTTKKLQPPRIRK
jgi:hypothetical protein